MVLDLDSVMINGVSQSVVTSDVVESNGPGVGANRRTGAFIGGGAALGALLGAIAGGGRGAASALPRVREPVRQPRSSRTAIMSMCQPKPR